MAELMTVPGADHFRQSITQAADAGEAALLRRLADWVDDLDADGLCRVESGERQSATTLYPRLLNDHVTIAYVWNHKGNAKLYINGKTIAKHAWGAHSHVEAAAGRPLPGNGMAPTDITDGLLNALTEAYIEAAGRGA